MAAACLLLAACGYPDPTVDRDPVATTTVGPPSAAPGADDFGEGGGQPAIKLPDGLQYIDLRPGSGATAKRGDQLTMQYTGWLENGKKFDSSRDRPGQPFKFVPGRHQVIAGWEEGVPGMKVGGRRKLIVPPDLGYGAQGQPPVIPANATLIFTVELVDVGPAPPESPSPSS